MLYYDRIKKYFKKILDKLLLAERSAQKLTLSCCLGLYMAFSPYITLQTWLIFPFSWLLGLNATVAMITLYTVSNPVTFVPIVITSYLTGQILLESVLGIDMIAYNPSWMQAFNDFLSQYIDIAKYLGTNLCFWCFMVGGNIAGIIIALCAYPLMKPMFTKLVKQFEKMDCKGKKDIYEDNNTK
jgi:uncharacterized protein (DUF2062 family)